MKNIAAWLDGLALLQYAESFAENHIDAETLPSLTDDDLKELGVVSLGHRKKLMAAIAVLDEAPETPLTPDQGEHRQVTVMFADLSGFTSLSASLGAEETHRLLNRYFEALDKIVADYGGRVDKHIGDNVMAVFGAPVAHNDDPERAVRAAFDMHQAIRRIAEETGRTLTIHVGIASGRVVASGTGSDTHREYTVTGESVNFAARLQDLAESNETLVSDAVQREVSHVADCETLGEKQLKGFDQPVEVFRVRALKTASRAAPSGALFGRDRELKQFAGIVGDTLESGVGQIILLRGEAGIGKTRLVQEFCLIGEREGFALHTGRVLDFGTGRGPGAIQAVLGGLIGLAPEATETMGAEAIEAACVNNRIEHAQRAFLYDLLGLTQPADLRAAFELMSPVERAEGNRNTLGALLRNAAGEQPRMIVVEDVHWADQEVLTRLAAIANSARDCPLLLVITSRIEGDPLTGTWRARAEGAPLTTIDLGPLTQEDALEFAQAIAGDDADLAARFVERADGNPLFLEQLLRNAADGDRNEIPASIESLVLARMDRLSAADRQALQSASIIGQRFATDPLCHLLGADTYDCAPLVNHYLVRPEELDFLFTHALIREGIYGSLLGDRRRALHRAAAAWYADSDPVLHAQHLERAEDPGAANAYRLAAEALAADYRYEQALQLAEKGMEIAEAPSDKANLNCLKGDMLYSLGSTEASVETYRAAHQQADTDALGCTALIGVANGLRVLDRYDDALAALDQAEELANRADRVTDRARIRNLRGNVCFPLGRMEECRTQHAMALKDARDADLPQIEALALSGLGDADYARGHMVSAYGHFRDCIELCKSHGLVRTEVANLPMNANSRRFLNELSEAIDTARQAVEAAEKYGQLRAEMIARRVLSDLYFDSGNLAGMGENLDRAEALARQLGARRFEFMILLLRVHELEASGKGAAVQDLAAQALAKDDSSGVGYVRPGLHGAIALASTEAEQQAEALRQGEALLATYSVCHNYHWFYRDAMEVSLRAQNWDDARRFAAAYGVYMADEPSPWSDFFIGRCLVLTDVGAEDNGQDLISRLDTLCSEAKQTGFKLALPALENARKKLA